MSTQSMLGLLDAVSGESGAGSMDGAVRRQAAFVRALVDEVERMHPSDFRISALHEQLAEELLALARIMPGADGDSRLAAAQDIVHAYRAGAVDRHLSAVSA
ncbi:MAG TPA: hypothetical protein VN712_02705 [Dermatophilaceae bacterium]|nr:hypothetical protein [Dermatophilaceae bacterium]